MSKIGLNKFIIFFLLSFFSLQSVISESIWGGNENLYSTPTKKYKAGDIVTIVITEESSAASTAGTNIQKEIESEVKINTIQGGAKNFFNGVLPRADIEANNKNDGKGSTTRTGKLSAVITAKVDRLLPNGFLYLRGRRKIRINKETQIITISGVARPKDITENNNISSTLLSDAEIKYEGKGPVGGTTKPGIINKIFNWLF
ncbi:flagellar basal body L-ring protein FlgH [Candidatus Riflebacteria bacterium]